MNYDDNFPSKNVNHNASIIYACITDTKVTAVVK